MEKPKDTSIDFRIMSSPTPMFERAGVMKMTKKSQHPLSMNEVQGLWEESLRALAYEMDSGMKSGMPLHARNYGSVNRGVLPVVVIVEVQNEVIKYMPTNSYPSDIAMASSLALQLEQMQIQKAYTCAIDPYPELKENKPNTNNLTLLL